jgi:hypothetical protein
MKNWITEARHDFSQDSTSIGWLNLQHRKIVAELGFQAKPHYAWGVVQGLGIAQALGVGQVSVAEFGVAGGSGLVSLEQIAVRAEAVFGVKVDVFGFDAGTGLPDLVDYRDSPNLFKAGTFPMDESRLRQRLTRTELILGDVASTIPSFIQSAPSPLAFVSFDLDLYSSTSEALKVFDAPSEALLPRVYCYFDDTIGHTHSEFAGALLAISEYNESHQSRKIAQIRGLSRFVSKQFSSEYWTESFYLLHTFDHPKYNQDDGTIRAQRMDL